MARTRRDPEERAAEVLRSYGSVNLPIDVGDIAEKLGAEIRYSELDSDLSGILVRDGTRKVIGVANGHSLTRKRYTIAHEIGHLLMHPGRPFIAESLGEIRVDQRGGEATGFADRREEREANQFAAALLMPADVVIDSWYETEGVANDATIQRIAKQFVVSTLAMKYRLLNLGLIGPHNTDDDVV